jgi:Domain of unknown function (DUF4865)
VIIVNYAHRLPADHDIGLIRARAKQRARLWDAVPELCFKAFMLREKGRYGSIANNYSSLYLWRQDEAFRDYLMSGRYRAVTDAFGRAEMRTRFALDARKGRGQLARVATMEEREIPVDADLTAVFAGEVERIRDVAELSGTVAAVVGVDPQNWRLTRILLSEGEPAGHEAGTRYEILHLSKPLLDTLPQTAD